MSRDGLARRVWNEFSKCMDEEFFLFFLTERLNGENTLLSGKIKIFGRKSPKLPNGSSSSRSATIIQLIICVGKPESLRKALFSM